MPLETATFVVSLVITNPDGSDQKNTADDHIRLIKACLKRTFPLLDGAVSLSHTQLMRLSDVSASVQLQLNQLRDGSATANNALYANSASFAANANNALSLGGFAAATYPRLSTFNTFTSYNWFAGVRVTQTFVTPATGEGLELDYVDGSRARINSINRGGSALMPLHIQCSDLSLIYTGTLNANGSTIWHAGNDGPGSGLNADLLDGLNSNAAAIGSTVVARTPDAFVYATYFNQSSNEVENPNVASVFVSNGDGFLRKATPAYLGTLMQTRNITGKAGVQKTISSSAPSGGNDGDIWYQI